MKTKTINKNDPIREMMESFNYEHVNHAITAIHGGSASLKTAKMLAIVRRVLVAAMNQGEASENGFFAFSGSEELELGFAAVVLTLKYDAEIHGSGIAIDELMQSMREAGSLANIRETAEKLRTENPDAYKVLCDFYAEAKRRAAK